MSDIVNPFIAGNPVTGSEMFFGREDVFQFIRQTLTGQHRDNVVVLYGQRRSGKTSVLYQARSHLDARYLCIFMDMHGFALEGLNGFLWELANHILRGLQRDYQIKLPSLKRDEFRADPRSFLENEFLSQVRSAIGDRHVLLMLDEVVYLEEQVRAGKLESEIFEYMRHLMQHYEWLNFLFSLGSSLEEMEKEYAFLFNVGLYKKISFLDRHTTIDLITQPVKDYYQVEPAAIERIYHITSGHPYYTQLLCHCLFNAWQRQRQRLSHMEVRDVDEVLDEATERGSAVLKYSWEELTPGEKTIVAGMAAAMGESNRAVGAKDINRAWRRCNVIIPEGEMAKAIRSLLARDVIMGQDQYAFSVDLQRLWVHKYRRIEWVKEEVADLPLEPFKSRHIPWPPSSSITSKIGIIPGIISSIVVCVLILASVGFFMLFRQGAKTATLPNSTNPYPPNTGMLALNDPLSSNSKGYNWREVNNSGESCTFTEGAYHAKTLVGGYYYPCFAKNTNFADFSYEVQMEIVKGDCGAILFRADSASGQFYYFRVCQDGSYALYLYRGKMGNTRILIFPKTNLAIHPGLNQINLVAVVARSSMFYLYMNHQKIDSISNSTYTHGQIAVVADGFPAHDPTEVVYSNAKVWKF